MKKIATLFIIIFSFSISSSAQMVNGLDTLYGNEWIQYDQTYHKISVAEDGIYRIPYSSLPTGNIKGNELQLFHLGQEIPIHVSSDGTFSSGDYIEFYGRKNKSHLDRYLFDNPDDEMANTEYSLFTDTSAYFLTWKENVISTQRVDNINNDLNNLSNPEDYCLYTESSVYNDKWIKDLRVVQGNYIYHSRYDSGEGFVSSIKKNQSFNIPTNSIFANGPKSKLTLRYSTGSQTGTGAHDQTILINGNQVAQDIFTGIRPKQHEFELTTNNLSSQVKVEVKGNIDNKDRTGVAFTKLTYPRNFDFGGNSLFHFKIDGTNPTQKKYLKVSNFDTQGGNPILYDITNHQRIVGSFDGTFVNIVIPPSSTEREFVLAADSGDGIKEVTQLTATNFIDYTQQDADFIIISNKRLYDDGQGNNWVQAYADYRASGIDGRTFNPAIVEIQQIYDQFSYGVNRHSISIRNYGHYIKRNWTNPRYVLILGKAREYQMIRSSENLESALNDNSFHVPTFGALGGADNLFLTSNLGLAPNMSVGRIPAKTGIEVKYYLDKVKEHEANPQNPQTIKDKQWMKRMVHLGGGSPGEQLALRSYLDGMKELIENNPIGAKVTSFFKQTADPIQISQTDALKDLINSGVSILTFFGHSSTGSFDYSIDNAASYSNKGKYPVMFSFGCFSGKIHTSSVGISEDFVLTPEKGAIAFFATTGIGFSNTLNVYGREFYNQLGGDSYGMGVGDISRRTIENVQNSIDFLGPQMTLNGDPAVRIFTSEGPDYIIDRGSVNFEPNPISVQKDSFDLTFDIANIGKNISDKFVVEITQKLPVDDQLLTIVIDTIQAPSFESTFSYRVPVPGIDALGPNEFSITIDKDNTIAEVPNISAEDNNTLATNGLAETITVHFISKEVLPVYPREFGIVSSPNLTLKASTTSAFLDVQKYIVQIDTTENFDSPFLQEGIIEQAGGVIKWKPNISYQNNQVYYWRVSPEEDPTIGGFLWKKSSFTYLAGSNDGWKQSHRFQYMKNKVSNLDIKQNGSQKFITDFKDIALDNFAVTFPWNQNESVVELFVANAPVDIYFGNPSSAIYVAVFDSTQIEPRPNNPNGFYNRNTFAFDGREADKREELINFLNNEVSDGEYVLFFTVQNEVGSYEPEEWASDVAVYGTSIFDELEAQGATQVRDLEMTGALPYVFLYQKGMGPLQEQRASTLDDFLNFNYAIAGSWDSGSITSTQIGPAKNWESLEWNASSLDNLSDDVFSIDIFGISSNGEDSLLMSNVQDFDLPLSSISAEEFPYLQLKFNTRDTINKTATQLDFWTVLYEGLPDVALNAASFFSFQSDTLQQGEPLELKIAVENISQYDMDSLLMNFSIIDQSNQQNATIKRIAPVISGDTLIATLNLDTRNLSDKLTMFIEANTNNDQREEHYFNNVGFFDFYVKKDKRNPLLDVTFDGFHIMDGDLVSSKPHILITLKDDNEYLLLDDTSSFQVLLKQPGSSNLIPIPIDGETLVFYPAAAGGNNKSRLEYMPILLQDGDYQLVVLAEDASGNQSGDLSYKVNFEVTNKSSISKVLNYPNPFSTSTRFVFTVTGDEVPDNMKIQIMTISGRIVREILMDELGPIHVGNNITQFSWNGTDEYGAKLANGVYLYRVVATKQNGEPFEGLQTKADQFFKNGFGKMVILR